MKKIPFIIILFAIVLSLKVNGQVNVLSNDPYQLVLNKQFQDAKNSYESLLKEAPNSFSLNYNLASTYYRLNDLINAKKYFLKALKISPGNHDTLHNLSVINKTFIDQQFIFEKHWNHILGFRISFILNISLIITLLILALIYCRIIDVFQNKFDRFGIIVIIFWSLALVSIIAIYLNEQTYGVVKVSKATIYSGPSETQKNLFFAHQGAEFRIKQSTNLWKEIQFPNGLKGWIKIKDTDIL